MSPSSHVTNDRVKSDSGFFFQTKKKKVESIFFLRDEDDDIPGGPRHLLTYMLPDGQQQLGSGVTVVV